MELLANVNPDAVSEAEAETYERRRAPWSVVQDSDGLVALMNVRERDFYKLPGGGIDDRETPEQAFYRECLEETGCQVRILGELGRTEEYHSQIKRWQTSYAYLAEVVGEKGETALEPGEINDGFVLEWLPPDEAIQTLQEIEGHPILTLQQRDLIILQAGLSDNG